MIEQMTTGVAGYVILRILDLAAITFCELMAAKAKADGREDWQDTFWLRMLKRLDSARAERVIRGPM